MTDKQALPVIGRRYKYKTANDDYKVWVCKNIKIERTPSGKRYTILEQEHGDKGQEFDLKRGFWNYFEELPDQEPTTEESSTVEKCKDCGRIYDANCTTCYDDNHNVDTNNKVQEALEEVKRELKEWEDDCLLSSNKHSKKPLNREGVISTFNHVQNLINALELNMYKKPLKEE